MEIEFDVNIKGKDLYDYMLRHVYNGFSGIFGTIAGVLLIANFLFRGSIITLIFGIAVIAYLPWTLFLKAQQQARSNPAFMKPLHYKMTEEGVEISQGEQIEKQGWDTMVKAVSTGNSIILYTSKVNASIFPKRDLGEKLPGVVEIISTHMQPSKVHIRA